LHPVSKSPAKTHYLTYHDTKDKPGRRSERRPRIQPCCYCYYYSGLRDETGKETEMKTAETAEMKAGEKTEKKRVCQHILFSIIVYIKNYQPGLFGFN
jgi:hypothetical protein